MLNSREKRYWLKVLISIFVIYAAVCAIAWLAADSMIFFPQYASRAEPDESRRIVSEDGTQLSVVHLPNPDAKYTLWYFHGNAESLADIAPRLKELRRIGFSVLAVEYPGYGTSGGTATEQQIYRSIDAGLRFLQAELKVTPDTLVIYGRSLGSGPAVELASRVKARGLILESGFTSAYRVMTRWPLLLGDRFTNLRKLSKVTCPVLVIHGRDDRTIPWHHGESLFKAARNPLKQSYWVENGGHNDLPRWMAERYVATLKEFAARL